MTSAPSTRRAIGRPRGGRSRPGPRPTCACCGLPCETRRGVCSATRAAGSAAPGVPGTRARRPRTASSRAAPLSTPRAPALGPHPGAAGKAGKGTGPAPGAAGEPSGPRACASPQSQATPGETIAGAAGGSGEAISRRPGALHGDARRGQPRPGEAATGPPAPARSPESAASTRAGRAPEPRPPSTSPSRRPPPSLRRRSLAPSLPPPPSRRGAGESGARASDCAREPAAGAAASHLGEVSADGRYFSLREPLCSVSDECQFVLLRRNH